MPKTEIQKEVIRCRACDASKNDKKLYVCSGCKTVWFCSRECQKIGWGKGHKEECKTLQSLFAQIPEEMKPDFESLRKWDLHHKPSLGMLVSCGLRLCDPNNPKRILVVNLELTKETSIPKRYKIKTIEGKTHAEMKSTAAMMGLPDLESMKAKKGHIIAFCLLLCSPAADMMPFEMDADPTTHRSGGQNVDVVAQQIITMINNGELYNKRR